MKSAIPPVICAIAVTLAAPFSLRAQNENIPPEIKAYAAQYVAAFNSRDESRLLSMSSAQSRGCITPANKDVYSEIARTDMRDSIPPKYILTFLPVNESNLKALASDEYFLVKPERELHIDYQYPNSNDGGLLILYLARQNGRWIGDFPCMTDHAIKDFRDNAPLRAHYRKLASGIKEPLRSELLAMLRKHQLGEAETRYRKATGCDMKTAVLVMDALKGQI